MLADGGLRLHPDTIAALNRSHRGRNHIWALWMAVAVLAAALLLR
jgi:hypothetical protein